jgi:hypothetical protein
VQRAARAARCCGLQTADNPYSYWLFTGLLALSFNALINALSSPSCWCCYYNAALPLPLPVCCACCLNLLLLHGDGRMAYG